MAKIPEAVVKESYLLRSTFFYNRLNTNGYFNLFLKVKKFVKVEGDKLDWSKRSEWNVSERAWDILKQNGIAPALVFVHPKVLKLNPSFLRFYRSIAMLPQKGLSAISRVSNLDAIEKGKADSGKIRSESVERLTKAINEVVSVVVAIATGLNERRIEGMMYATAGTNIDGSWRNQIGAEGERVIRTIIMSGLLLNGEVTSFIDKANNTVEISSPEARGFIEDIDLVKSINLSNGFSVYFSSEPDVTLYNPEGDIVGVIEIKAGLDPAGALERLGAMFKSFENTLAEYPEAVTILVASCITKEVDSRLNASMVVRQKYITTDITANDREKRKFVNRLRAIMKLARPSL
ncbi:MAG: XcyI family restriction endonuclease [Pseudoflavonifractor sp.]|nr:XcyI family restriction endonuclease [Alloprevotella sp.]MCM1115958.1 XcyI family restriction endonuclease [Pseudoflavonifractor sp.]